MSEFDHTWEAQTLLIGRVRDAHVRSAVFVSARASIREAAEAMAAGAVTCVLVDGADGARIVTGTDIRNALAIRGESREAPAASIARGALLTIDASELLLQALVLMDRHHVRRLVVTEGGSRIVGVLEQPDVLTFLVNHSDAISLRIREARQPDELKPAFDALLRLIAALHRNGTRTDAVGHLASDINRAIFQRVFELVMPEPVRAGTCLLVMGSEGRAEQILPTDQDNALIVRDGFEDARLDEHCAAFTEALVRLGYPPCPGGIMISNPAWRLSESAFRQRVREWADTADNDAVMNLAIFFDAVAAAGDARLLPPLRAAFFDDLRDSDAFFARFASAIMRFPSALKMFSRFRVETDGAHQDMLDIKKGGVFPIVHGVRSLAMEKRLSETSTLVRIARLRELRVLDRKTAREVASAFEVLSRLRAASGLEAWAKDRPVDNFIRPDDLDAIDQDLLRESFRVVNRFRDTVKQHFRLEMLGF